MGCKYFPGLDFEIDGRLDQKWIQVEHPLVITRHKLALNVIAAIVQTTCSYVSTSSFETVGL